TPRRRKDADRAEVRHRSRSAPLLGDGLRNRGNADAAKDQRLVPFGGKRSRQNVVAGPQIRRRETQQVSPVRADIGEREGQIAAQLLFKGERVMKGVGRFQQRGGRRNTECGGEVLRQHLNQRGVQRQVQLVEPPDQRTVPQTDGRRVGVT